MPKYKHLAIYPDTDTRFNKVKPQIHPRHQRPVTDDELLNFLLDLWEQHEADVKP